MRKLITVLIAIVVITSGCASVRRGATTTGETVGDIIGVPLVGKILIRNDSTHTVEIQQGSDPSETKELKPRHSYEEKFWGPKNEFTVTIAAYRGGTHRGTVTVKYCGPTRNNTDDSLVLTDGFFRGKGTVTGISYCPDDEPSVRDADYSKRRDGDTGRVRRDRSRSRDRDRSRLGRRLERMVDRKIREAMR